MPLDVQLTLYNRIWELLEAYAPFTAAVGVANRIKSTTQQSQGVGIDRARASTTPVVQIDVAEMTSDMNAQTVIDDDPSDVDRGIPIVINFDIKTTHPKTELGLQTPTEAAIEAAMLTAGSTLGIGWVSTCFLRGTTRRQEQIDKAQRTVSRCRLVVKAMPYRSQLIS